MNTDAVPEKRVNPDRLLYAAAAIISALLMVAGFARTYFFKVAFGTPPLSGFLHVHGVVMTLWFTLFLVQVRLVAGRRLDLHRRLGWIAAGLAVLLVVLGLAAAISGARNGHTPGPPPLVFMMMPVAIMFLFALFTGLAIFYRNRPDIHKRLMLLGSVNLLSPAIGRIPGLQGGAAAPIGLSVFLILACVVTDTIRNRRLHPVLGWGGGFLILSLPLRMVVANTETWQRFAAWLVAST